MIRNCLLFLCALFFCAAPAKAEQPVLNISAFAQLPVQRAGRIEPVDSFARAYFKQFYGNRGNQTATEWLAELLFDPERAYARENFYVAHPDVRHALGLAESGGHLYSFQALSAAMSMHADLIQGLMTADNKKTVTDSAQQQILVLYQNLMMYFELSRSLSLVLPDFEIDSAVLAEKIGVPAHRGFSYLEMMQHKAAFLKQAQLQLKDLKNRQPNADQENLLKTGYLLEHMEADKQSRLLQIVPVPWAEGRELWLSPWAILQAGQGSPQTASLLNIWQEMAAAYRAHDQAAWDKAGGAILKQTQAFAGNSVRPAALKAEYIYNLLHLFVLSGALYFLALVFCAARHRVKFLPFYRLSLFALVAGFLLHAAGLGLRIFILARPPVGTLYESILFVGWIAVAGSLLFEGRNRQGTGLLAGAIAGLVLQMLAPLFAQSGDTMAPLVAVLNTNFWLATHVLCITTGYGACLVTGLLAHIYLVQKITAPDKREKLLSLSYAITGAALIALGFATIGTILGGIWADQSWGRFWGWDPKENGALLIVLWLLFVLHGKLSGLLRADNFALCAAATIVVVAVSWFGVNLLNVGLHSYGFTSGIALYLGVFVASSLAVLAVCKILLSRQGRVA